MQAFHSCITPIYNPICANAFTKYASSKDGNFIQTVAQIFIDKILGIKVLHKNLKTKKQKCRYTVSTLKTQKRSPKPKTLPETPFYDPSPPLGHLRWAAVHAIKGKHPPIMKNDSPDRELRFHQPTSPARPVVVIDIALYFGGQLSQVFVIPAPMSKVVMTTRFSFRAACAPRRPSHDLPIHCKHPVRQSPHNITSTVDDCAYR